MANAKYTPPTPSNGTTTLTLSDDEVTLLRALVVYTIEWDVYDEDATPADVKAGELAEGIHKALNAAPLPRTSDSLSLEYNEDAGYFRVMHAPRSWRD